ncbi:MAG: SAM-dependent methyltransferase [Nitrososphaerota archaeon]|nr:SAM-dependent methyltransferase [Candidatus Bathyarchaeota archaeon]MDW8194230.1 SAM-dependent methyltransferase [Nitrososphaerota archaeon]
MKPIFVIEHLEPELSKWLLYEYAHASQIVGKDNLLFTNVKVEKAALKLRKLGGVEEKAAAEIFPPDKVIVLDPRAEHPLKPDDVLNIETVIIGGILGDHPPKGRTFSLITSRFSGAAARNLGRDQFSIDGAIYVAKLVSQGVPLEQIPIKRGLRLRLNEYAEVYLPYAYPLKDGKPVISRKLIAYLRSERIVRDEEKLIKF